MSPRHSRQEEVGGRCTVGLARRERSSGSAIPRRRNTISRCQSDVLRPYSNLHCEGPVDQQKSSRGGARVGAGRKKSNARRHDPPHRARRELSADHPVHVVLRAARYVPELRQRRVYEAACRVLARYVDRDDFRVVQISIQDNHFHFLNEAADREALSKGMQSLTINLARAIQPRGGQLRQGLPAPLPRHTDHDAAPGA